MASANALKVWLGECGPEGQRPARPPDDNDESFGRYFAEIREMVGDFITRGGSPGGSELQFLRLMLRLLEQKISEVGGSEFEQAFVRAMVATLKEEDNSVSAEFGPRPSKRPRRV